MRYYEYIDDKLRLVRNTRGTGSNEIFPGIVARLSQRALDILNDQSIKEEISEVDPRSDLCGQLASFVQQMRIKPPDFMVAHFTQPPTSMISRWALPRNEDRVIVVIHFTFVKAWRSMSTADQRRTAWVGHEVALLISIVEGMSHLAPASQTASR